MDCLNFKIPVWNTIVLLIAVAVTFTEGVDAVPVPVQVEPDSSEVNLRLIDSDRLSEYRSDPSFHYDERPELSESLIDLIITELFKILDGVMEGETSGTVVRVIFLLLLMGAVLLVMNQILKGNIKNAFYGKQSAEEVRFRRDPLKVSEEDLDDLIEQAANSGNYREAVRLIYHKALQDLSRSGQIEWAVNKTNQDYICETEPHPASEPLRKLTRIYDYTEYGDFYIDSNGLKGVKEIYGRLSNVLEIKQVQPNIFKGGGHDEQKG